MCWGRTKGIRASSSPHAPLAAGRPREGEQAKAWLAGTMAMAAALSMVPLATTARHGTARLAKLQASATQNKRSPSEAHAAAGSELAEEHTTKKKISSFPEGGRAEAGQKHVSRWMRREERILAKRECALIIAALRETNDRVRGKKTQTFGGMPQTPTTPHESAAAAEESERERACQERKHSISTPSARSRRSAPPAQWADARYEHQLGAVCTAAAWALPSAWRTLANTEKAQLMLGTSKWTAQDGEASCGMQIRIG